MGQLQDLRLLLRSRVSLVAVETREENRFLQVLKDLANTGSLQQPLFSWSVTTGLARLDRDLGVQTHNIEPEKVLRHIATVTDPGVYVLLDFHPYLSDPTIVRLLKDIALDTAAAERTLLLVSHELSLPDDLRHLSATFSLGLPENNEREMLVNRVIADCSRESGKTVDVDEQARELLVRNLAGLPRRDIERVVRHAVLDDHAVTRADLPDVMRSRYQLLAADGVLEYTHDPVSLGEVAGLDAYKRWLAERRLFFTGTAPEGLDGPRGVLLIGVQGCGKSLAAKATAAALALPLLRLDLAAIYNKYHGESERNLRETLRQAEVLSPCVLWIDELEKAIGTAGDDSGVSRRVLGSFITWLAEKPAGVFVVATANEVRQLPPELIRKGRFDEVFFVDLPDSTVRQRVLQIHLERRGRDAGEFPLAELASACEGFSGAEIEQAVVSAMYSAEARSEPLTGKHLLNEFARTRPLSVLMAEQLGALRAWAGDRTVPAH